VQLNSFWPPQRTVDRLRFELYSRRHPELPWLPREATETLSNLLRRRDRCLEWGSGRSTPWLAERVGSLVSVEHDQGWHDSVRARLAENSSTRAVVRLESIEPSNTPQETPYVRVVDEFQDGELDVAFVDGEHRCECARSSIPKLAPGGLLIVDDAHLFLDHDTRTPHSRRGRGALDLGWQQFVGEVDSWRMLWIEDGFSDTAIYFKP
jgi:predicted O-methyltransferase YrrM